MLSNLKIEPRAKSPLIQCNCKSGEILIKGRSIMENPFDFYENLNNWIIDYTDNQTPKTTITIKFEYLNSGSKRSLFPIFKNFKKINNLIVNWHYPEDDPDLKEVGEDFQSELEIIFNIISTNPDEF